MLTIRKRGRVYHVRGSVRLGGETRRVKEHSTGCDRREDAEAYRAPARARRPARHAPRRRGQGPRPDHRRCRAPVHEPAGRPEVIRPVAARPAQRHHRRLPDRQGRGRVGSPTRNPRPSAGTINQGPGNVRC
jgi:hypothetical protein